MVEEEPDEPVQIPLDFVVPEDVTSRYATNFVVQFTGEEFIISFFEAQPPMIVGSSADRKEKLGKIKSLRANCIARIVVTPTRMRAFAKLMQGQVSRLLTAEEAQGE